MDLQTRAVEAIGSGDVEALASVLDAHPTLATAYLSGDQEGRTLLHVATDWPGHRARVAETIRLLVERGADVDAPFVGSHAETALHWAASCDDVEALDALLEAGAAIDTPGGVIGDGTGTPLMDATVFAQWAAARRLLERGAATGGWEEASLGLVDRLQARLPAASQDQLDGWLWASAHGGQPGAARLLLDAGADPSRPAPWDGSTPLDEAGRAHDAGTPGAAAVRELLGQARGATN
jgi:ankyrin repeat protein